MSQLFTSGGQSIGASLSASVLPKKLQGWLPLGLTAEKAMAPHSGTLAWEIPWMEEPGRLQSMGSRRVGHDWVNSLSLFTFTHWRRQWQPIPVFLPGESQGQGSLVGYRLWGRRVRHDWSDLAAAGLTGLISLLSKGLSRPSQGLLRHRSLKESILQCSALFMVQFSHPYMTTGKTRGLTLLTFVGKAMSLLFNTLSRFVIAFLPRSNFSL